MALATVCTLEPVLEINIVISVYYLKNVNQIPSQLCCNVNKPRLRSKVYLSNRNIHH